MKINWLLSMLVFLAASFASVAQAKHKNAVANEENSTAINWTLKNLQQQEVNIQDYHGKPVLLVFWATWCPYCKKLFPGVNRLYEQYKAQGFTVIAMNIREDGDPAAYMQKHGYQFEVALESDAVAKQYGVKGTPTLVFIDKSGEVLAKANFSDPEHPALEHFVKEQLGLLKK